MPIQFRCNHCDKLIQAPDSAGGMKARCALCGQINEVPIYKPDAGASGLSDGFDQFLAQHGSQGMGPPPPPRREAARPAGDQIPEFIAPARHQSRGRVSRPGKLTPLQVVTMTCGIAIVLLYAFFGLAIGAIMAAGPSKDGIGPGQAIVTFILGPPLLVSSFVLYFAPSLIAYIRRHQNAVPIFIVNAVFGWLIIGWIGGLAWAFSSDVRESRQYVRQVIVREPDLGENFGEL